jgi:CheY-like chemotaxis protein
MEAPKILIVDDEPALQMALKMALKNEGYQLHFADNGHKGLEMFHAEKPELVFLDLKMPVMDGYQFLQSLELSPDSPFTIIVITGHGIDREIEKCYTMGIDFFLKKPLSMVEICCVARRCIEIKRLKAERERLIENLRQANETINYLKTFLVICSSCKRVRDEEENWHDLDAYIRTHTKTEFSHGICPDCIEILYPDILDVIGRKKK